MKPTRLVIFGLIAATSLCRAQITEPGWYLAPSQNALTEFPTTETIGGTPSESGGEQSGSAPIAEASAPAIQALAHGLQNDPFEIFSYVHDHIRHDLYYGAKKGAALTLLEKSGNDFDQCALMVALLQAAGYTNCGYGFGWLQIPYDDPNNNHQDLRHWLRLTLTNTNWDNTITYLGQLFGTRGYPQIFQIGDNNTVVLQRVWVWVVIGGDTWYLDPAFKVSEQVAGLNLATAMGLNTTNLLSAAGGTTTSNSVRNLNEPAIRTNLLNCTTNFLAYLQSNTPNASVEEVLGGWNIVPATIWDIYNGVIFVVNDINGLSPWVTWSYQPTNLMADLVLILAGTNYHWWLPQLQGQRVTLIYDTNGVAQLWQEDTQLLQKTTVAADTNVVLAVNHPYGSWNFVSNVLVNGTYSDATVTNSYQRTNGTYNLMYAFSPDWGWLQERQMKLQSYRQQGLADNSRQITSETLNVMGLDWLLQTEMDERLFASQLAMLPEYPHRFGRMAQEAGRGYYVDVYMQLTAQFPSSGVLAPDAQHYNQHFDLTLYFGSALEHGVIEQLQSSNLLAASTVRLLQLASTNGQTIYLASSTNWTAVQNALTNYNADTLTKLSAAINSGNVILLPQNGSIPIADSGSWKGYGYVARRETNGVVVQNDFIISGGYLGGFIAWPSATINSPYVDWTGAQQPQYYFSTPTFTPAPSIGDPVDPADGTFQVDAVDLSLAGAEPRGLTLSRYYNGTRRYSNPAGMSPGWVHNYLMNANTVPAPRAGLGGTTPAQAAPMIVATCASVALYDGSHPEAKNWLVTALITKWGVDQLITNGVSVALGKDAIQFVKQPHGVFTPPAGSTMTLTQSSSAYVLQERHGNTFKFDTLGRLTNIVDQYSKPLNVSYINSTSTLPQTVTDWKSRSLTFNYTSNRLTSVSDSTGRSVSYVYTNYASGQSDLVAVSDAESKTNRFLYDTNHQIVATYDALGRLVVSNVYDDLSHIATQYTQGDTNKTWQIFWSGWKTVEQDPAGGQRAFSYDDQNRLVSLRNQLSNLTQTYYDGQDHVVMTISPLNETNRFEFDGRHNLLRSIDALNFTNSLFYDAQDNLIRTVDARGNTNRFGYNSKFQLTGSTNGTGDWITFGYDPTDGTFTSRTDSGGTTSYGYDGNGLLNSITYPGSLGGESFGNHPRGDVTNYTNARGFVTSFQYNNRRELTNTVATTNLTTKVSYDAVGNVQSITDARTNTTTYYWSPTRKRTGAVMPGTPQGVPAVTNFYDSRDWLSRSLDPVQQPTLYTNDVAGRLISMTDPLLRTIRFGYDADGRRTATTNAAQQITREQWNARGELTQLTDAATYTVKRAYDGTGNQIALTNRNSKKWQFQFDAANRLTNTISPRTNETRLTFDTRGLLSTVREPSGQTNANYYDAKGRLTNQVDTLGSKLYRYDANNNVTNIVEGGRTNTWTYDAYDHVSSYTDADGYVIQYRYDPNGNLTSLIYPGNRTVTYAYDSLNRLTNVTDWANRQTSFEYDLASRLKKIIRPNGTLREITYDAAGQTTNIVERLTNNAPIAFMRFNWNSNATVQWEFIAPVASAYTAPTRTMTYDEDNRLLTFNGSYVTNDADGNLIYGPLTNSTPITYSYDTRNRLTNASGVSYGHDPAGNRTPLTNGATVTRFVINPNAALSQVLMRVKTGVTNYYIYGLGLLYEITETASSTNLATYHYDYRGSTIAICDGNGNPTDRIEYSPYGTTTYRAGGTDTPFLFNGRYGVQTDPNKLLYMRARYYNPYLCRFLNPDPSGFSGGLNFYAYANGNPVSYLDPFGLGAGNESAWSWMAGAGVGVLRTIAGLAEIMTTGPDPVRDAQIGITLGIKYGASGYYEQYGGWSTALMVAGEFVGTTPFAEGVYGVDMGWGTPLTSFESGERTSSGTLQMVGTAMALYGGAKGFTGPAPPSGETFFHYTQTEIPAGSGLRAGSGVTSVGNLTATEAMFQLGIDPPKYVYPVTLGNSADFLIRDVGIPARSRVPAWEVINETPPGSVGSPRNVPPGKR